MNMVWDYDTPGEDEPNIKQVAKEINGYNVETNAVLPGFAALTADGTTACGCWIHSGYWAEDKDAKVPAVMRRLKKDPSGLGLYHNGAFPGRQTDVSYTTVAQRIWRATPGIQRNP
ncbi:hypothetical protein N752_15710 [Desulforamulus aquiferis]|nr:hypothetical protein N752_15710 [Desulforamulus aquiferis]